MSVNDAIMKFSKRQLGGANVRKKANKSPEKKIQKEVLLVGRDLGIDLSIIESKAVYSAAAGRYLRGQAEAGFPDLVGNTDAGHAVFIELKAPGRLSTLKIHQYEFLSRKIRQGAFAACVDSGRLFANIFSNWSLLMRENKTNAMDFLLASLPKKFQEQETTSDDLPW